MSENYIRCLNRMPRDRRWRTASEIANLLNEQTVLDELKELVARGLIEKQESKVNNLSKYRMSHQGLDTTQRTDLYIEGKTLHVPHKYIPHKCPKSLEMGAVYFNTGRKLLVRATGFDEEEIHFEVVAGNESNYYRTYEAVLSMLEGETLIRYRLMS